MSMKSEEHLSSSPYVLTDKLKKSDFCSFPSVSNNNIDNTYIKSIYIIKNPSVVTCSNCKQRILAAVQQANINNNTNNIIIIILIIHSL